MKKFIMFTLIIISILILINSTIVINTIIYSINLFKNRILPSLLPFFIVSDLLINYGFIEFTSNIFKPIMKLFKLNSNCSFILVMSMISGFPSSAKYTKDLYDKKLINDIEATKILTFTHFSNPLFILGFISLLLNKKIGLFILIIHYLTNFIIGFIFRNIIKTDINKNKIDENISKSFSNVLSSSIINSFNTLFLILGTMIVFLVLTNLINEYIALNPLLKGILNGILEMTGGINTISNLNISLKLKSTLIGMILSFGGLSVHMQVKSVIADTNIKYQPYLIARLLHSSITGILIYFLFDIIIKT
jgi:sporulation integral membrane protein YlbJ